MKAKFFVVIVLLTVLFISSVNNYDPVIYGQVISKEFVADQYIVIIQGRTVKGKLKNKTIYLDGYQYNYTNIGDKVDIGTMRGAL